MPNKPELAGLIDRVEKLAGPDREVDARIAVALGDVIMRGYAERGFAFFRVPLAKGDWAFLSGCKNGEEDAYRSLGQCLNTKRYTASLDAAVALVERYLPGWVWYVEKIDGIESRKNICEADIWIPGQRTKGLKTERFRAGATTPAIALILALLRAMQEERTPEADR